MRDKKRPLQQNFMLSVMLVRNFTPGNSLKDCLLVGPQCQVDFFNILFRLSKVQSADVTKIYRQVELSLEGCAFHRISWCKNSRVQE